MARGVLGIGWHREVSLQSVVTICYAARMTEQEELTIVAAYSDGKLRRAEMLNRLGLEVGFAETFRLLAKHHLPMPDYPQGSSPEGRALLREALNRSHYGR